MTDLFDISSGHKDLKEDDVRYFGEWVFWDTQEDLDDAYKYLALWKKFHLKRLLDMQQDGHDQFILRPAMYEESLGKVLPNMGRATLAIKIAMKKKSSNLPID